MTVYIDWENRDILTQYQLDDKLETICKDDINNMKSRFLKFLEQKTEINITTFNVAMYHRLSQSEKNEIEEDYNMYLCENFFGSGVDDIVQPIDFNDYLPKKEGWWN